MQVQIGSVFELRSIFWRFLPNFSHNPAPLNKMLCDDQIKSFLSLNVEGEQAVECFKNVVASPPVLALPMVTCCYTVDTDACNKRNWLHTSTRTVPWTHRTNWIFLNNTKRQGKRTKNGAPRVSFRHMGSTVVTPLSWRQPVQQPTRP